ncbi:hypothetical protein NLJ89_g2967 [Agrocybe chaxingu]|uniref:Uncharacterized protein n=1 Tax=Agrocybe chaxingu TaxID=84603 RepID=A0A9W8K6H6_9AGAR|nr:hypothetical protein NLJ89_g2967 [Agrocybe chaxingu]
MGFRSYGVYFRPAILLHIKLQALYLAPVVGCVSTQRTLQKPDNYYIFGNIWMSSPPKPKAAFVTVPDAISATYGRKTCVSCHALSNFDELEALVLTRTGRSISPVVMLFFMFLFNGQLSPLATMVSSLRPDRSSSAAQSHLAIHCFDSALPYFDAFSFFRMPTVLQSRAVPLSTPRFDSRLTVLTIVCTASIFDAREE